MFNKALKARKAESYKYYKEYLDIISSRKQTDGIIGDITSTHVSYMGSDFCVQPQWTEMMDWHDEHTIYENIVYKCNDGYSVVTGYYGPAKTLDFRWMKPQDIINLSVGPNVRYINMNSVNLRYSIIKSDHTVEYDIDVNTGFMDVMISLKEFLRNNKEHIQGINFNGKMSKLLMNTLRDICVNFGVFEVSFNQKREEGYEDQPYTKTKLKD